MLRGLFEILLGLELVLQKFGEVAHVFPRGGRRAVFLHWMSHFVVFVLAAFSSEKTSLAHVEVETLEASVPESTYGRLLANVALCRVFG